MSGFEYYEETGKEFSDYRKHSLAKLTTWIEKGTGVKKLDFFQVWLVDRHIRFEEMSKKKGSKSEVDGLLKGNHFVLNLGTQFRLQKKMKKSSLIDNQNIIDYMTSRLSNTYMSSDQIDFIAKEFKRDTLLNAEKIISKDLVDRKSWVQLSRIIEFFMSLVDCLHGWNPEFVKLFKYAEMYPNIKIFKEYSGFYTDVAHHLCKVGLIVSVFYDLVHVQC